jgi:hypothetical protein
MSSYGAEDWTMTSEEIDVLKTILREDFKTNLWSHKTRIKLENKDKWEGKDKLQGVSIVIFTKSLTLTWYKHIERNNNERMPNQIVSDRIEEIKIEDYHG